MSKASETQLSAVADILRIIAKFEYKDAIDVVAIVARITVGLETMGRREEDMRMKRKQQDATVCADCDAYKSQIQELHARQTEVLRYFDEAYLASKSDVETNTVLEIYKAIRAIIDNTGAPEPSAGGTQS